MDRCPGIRFALLNKNAADLFRKPGCVDDAMPIDGFSALRVV